MRAMFSRNEGPPKENGNKITEEEVLVTPEPSELRIIVVYNSTAGLQQQKTAKTNTFRIHR